MGALGPGEQAVFCPCPRDCGAVVWRCAWFPEGEGKPSSIRTIPVTSAHHYYLPNNWFETHSL